MGGLAHPQQLSSTSVSSLKTKTRNMLPMPVEARKGYTRAAASAHAVRFIQPCDTQLNVISAIHEQKKGVEVQHDVSGSYRGAIKAHIRLSWPLNWKAKGWKSRGRKQHTKLQPGGGGGGALKPKVFCPFCSAIHGFMILIFLKSPSEWIIFLQNEFLDVQIRSMYSLTDCRLSQMSQSLCM